MSPAGVPVPWLVLACVTFSRRVSLRVVKLKRRTEAFAQQQAFKEYPLSITPLVADSDVFIESSEAWFDQIQ